MINNLQQHHPQQKLEEISFSIINKNPESRQGEIEENQQINNNLQSYSIVDNIQHNSNELNQNQQNNLNNIINNPLLDNNDINLIGDHQNI